MHFEFTVSAEVERIEGKFANRDELEEQISEALMEAQPSSLEGENGGQYEVTDWNVDAVIEEKAPKKVVRPLVSRPNGL